jgi:hypothetical protein
LRALEDLNFRCFPDDLEVESRFCVPLWETKDMYASMGSRKAVEALAKQVLAVNR